MSFMDIWNTVGDAAEGASNWAFGKQATREFETAGDHVVSGLADADQRLTGGAVGNAIDGAIGAFDSLFSDDAPKRGAAKRPAGTDGADARAKQIQQMAQGTGDLWRQLDKGAGLKWGGSKPGASSNQGGLKGPGALDYANCWVT